MSVRRRLQELIKLSEAIGGYEKTARMLDVLNYQRLCQYREHQQRLYREVLEEIQRPTLLEVIDHLFLAFTCAVLAPIQQRR